MPATPEPRTHLTKPQQHVVDQMRQGWTLRSDMNMQLRVWLQRGTLGDGGDMETVHRGTFSALLRLKVIRLVKRKYPTVEWELAGPGASAAVSGC